MAESKAAKAAAKVLRQSNNEWSNKYFAIAIGAIMFLFAVHYWAGFIQARYGPKKIYPVLIRTYRRIGHFLSTSSIFGTRIERLLLYIVYWAINLILALTNVDLTQITYVAKRFGWISVANLVLLVFLALKNTPLAPLTGNSYEKLRPLHKVAGYTCIFTSVLHGIVYLSAWGETGKLATMSERKDYAGAIAGTAMVIIAFSTITYFTRRYYELFYMLHIIMFALIIITVGMHRPDFSSSTVIIVIFTACLWVMDRIIRGAKIVWNSFGNSATITALPNEAVRVRLNRRMRASPGSHAFLWVPAIRWVESHPFTLLSSTPSEFVIRVYDGFTRDLYKAAQHAPGKSLRCSVDGPYGEAPDFKIFDKVILIAGGSGASFTFAIALDLIETSTKKVKSIDFIWVVRHHESLEWFSQELKRLHSCPDVNLIIHITGPFDLSGLSSPTVAGSILEKVSVKDDITQTVPCPIIATNDLEKGHLSDSGINLYSSTNYIRPGRPDIASVINEAATSHGSPDDRVIVGACGPKELISTTRNAVNNDLRNERLAVTFYSEEFEW
ncbi:hypothetical protein N7466_009810 [Penicillium verhagenii]|uniref:uncharacterized protein n=1 Tax=Penicillium verhagenii TaxID=1562060 RepID=UPI0025453BC2|nr:uncharacterized protein N7466_009810 [Penicillium verhagenii]KAJ5921484.1 hypothetical protein N7466_009810 [Penicillium verhagenii]